MIKLFVLTDKRKKFGITTKQYEELTHTIDTFDVKIHLFCFLILIDFYFKSEYLQITLRPAELLKQTDNFSLQKE